MISDPYSVLGLSPNATDEEVKRAYRALAKKYHPDMNPGDAAAAQKMNEINAAYDQIKNPQQQTTYKNTYQDPFAGWYRQSSSYTGDADSMRRAEQYVQLHQYAAANSVLQSMPQSQRTARWYYLSAICNTMLGNRVLGYEQINKACSMEPDNAEYQQAKTQIEQNGFAYSEEQDGFHFGTGGVGTCCGMCFASWLFTQLCGSPWPICLFC